MEKIYSWKMFRLVCESLFIFGMFFLAQSIIIGHLLIEKDELWIDILSIIFAIWWLTEFLFYFHFPFLYLEFVFYLNFCFYLLFISSFIILFIYGIACLAHWSSFNISFSSLLKELLLFQTCAKLFYIENVWYGYLY